jgi:hypothetical protein
MSSNECHHFSKRHQVLFSQFQFVVGRRVERINHDCALIRGERALVVLPHTLQLDAMSTIVMTSLCTEARTRLDSRIIKESTYYHWHAHFEVFICTIPNCDPQCHIGKRGQMIRHPNSPHFFDFLAMGAAVGILVRILVGTGAALVGEAVGRTVGCLDMTSIGPLVGGALIALTGCLVGRTVGPGQLYRTVGGPRGTFFQGPIGRRSNWSLGWVLCRSLCRRLCRSLGWSLCRRLGRRLCRSHCRSLGGNLGGNLGRRLAGSLGWSLGRRHE